MQNFSNRYLEASLALIRVYDGKQPLAIYLKKYFALNKKHGSKDRKWITHFCYCYYRLGFALQEINDRERLRIAIFLCTENGDNPLPFYDESWQLANTKNIDERIRLMQLLYGFSSNAIFFRNDWLNDDIDVTAFNKSHLVQPDLFIRIRPGKSDVVNSKLHQHQIVFYQVNENCLALHNATNIDTVITLNKEAVIQDYSSQQVASFFELITLSKPLSVWDCCAASGGKSILAWDYFTSIKLTVSDIRESIIQNLAKRFREAGIHQYQSFVADISLSNFSLPQYYDLVICDVPCSGSGTWSRTPEQLYFFTLKKLTHYVQLQKKITATAIKQVQRNGCFLYITCSVFKQENEEMVAYIQSISKLKLVKAATIKGYINKADTMFAALFSNA